MKTSTLSGNGGSKLKNQLEIKPEMVRYFTDFKLLS